MNSALRSAVSLALSLLFVACAKPGADSNSNSGSEDAQVPRSGNGITGESSELQTISRDTNFENLMASLDFNAAGASSAYKAGGTSLGLALMIGNKKIGKWLPTNGAADPEAQVVAYRLGRYLQMSENVAPSAYFTLTGRALSNFGQMMRNHGEEDNQWREENRQNLMAALQKDPAHMFGMFMNSPSTYEVEELEDTDSNTINSRHPIAGFVRADGPLPSATKRMGFKGVSENGKVPTETELELSRQFSRIMVLDALTAQWDRWSGGNLEVAVSKSADRVYFIARDDGGASMSNGSGDKSLALVSRFDRKQINRLKQLVEKLSNPAQSAALVQLLQLRSNPKTLLARANSVLASVDNQVRRSGANAFFQDAN